MASESDAVLVAARHYVNHGIAVTPVHYRSKAAVDDWKIITLRLEDLASACLSWGRWRQLKSDSRPDVTLRHCRGLFR